MRTVVVGITIGLALTAIAQSPQTGGIRMKVPDAGDYSKFQHTTDYHARLPCLLCHRRETNAAVPVIPAGTNHMPCAGCHVKQFADSSNAICTICHDQPLAGTLKTFPRLGSFNMKFDHTSHSSACGGCHQPSRGGVALTIPAGFKAHVTCFQCHGSQAKSGERDISSCGLCHEPGPYRRRSQASRAVKVGFSHEEHNRKQRLSCNDCHRLRTGGRSNGVTAPQPLNHHAASGSFSCMSCHNGKKAFGGDDFSVCKRCHQGSAWRL
jgi:c(7)-type cytochrome triheme protein